MLRFQHLSLRRGERLLFADADFIIHAGDRVGVTGGNGTGKSSLFALIRGELHPDQGELDLPTQLTVAYVAQETPAVDKPAVEYVMDGDQELRDIEQALADAEARGEGTRQAELHARLETIGGYAAKARAAKLLQGLGFSTAAQHQPVAHFSGGWRMRLNLAQALMCRSDLLLLDEPTNHLDLDAVLWLEEWLTSYTGTLLLISHDRDFLDAVVTHIAHLENTQLTLERGDYTTCERRRAERLALQQAAYAKQQREIAHMQAFIDRFRAKATKARQAQSRLKALERMQTIAPVYASSSFHFSFPAPAKIPNPLLRLDEVALGYERPILSGIRFGLDPGDRIGLLGPNGAGKSTLIKLLAAQLDPLAGEQFRDPNLRVGYFAQHQLEQLDLQASPLLHLQRLDPKATEQSLRDFLGGFGFPGDFATGQVAPFSGGEKARLVLALLVYQRPNLLLLDEPTNHLDMAMRHALSVALQDFNGALVVVAHDRALLRAVADRFVLVADGQVNPFEGDLDDYRQWLKNRRDSGAPPLDSTTHRAANDNRKAKRRTDAARRERVKPLRQQMQHWEREIDRLQTALQEIETALADPSLYAESAKAALTEQLQRQGQLSNELAAAEQAWLEAGEALEAAEADA